MTTFGSSCEAEFLPFIKKQRAREISKQAIKANANLRRKLGGKR